MGRLKGAAGRWAPGMGMDWVPLAPERVAEVRYTHVDGHRLRLANERRLLGTLSAAEQRRLADLLRKLQLGQPPR